MNDNTIETASVATAGGLNVRIAQELVDRARTEGLGLTGPNGLLAAVSRNVIQAALKVLYLAIRDRCKNQPNVVDKTAGWKRALQQFAMYFGDRVTAQTEQ